MKLTIEQVLAQHSAELMRTAGVTGVGEALCEGESCLRVYIAAESVRQRIPTTLEGYRVSVVVTGVVRPRSPD